MTSTTIISKPSTTVNIVGAVTEVANESQKLLFVGQQTSAATANSGDLTTNIQNDNSWDTLYGIDSMLAAMLRTSRNLNIKSQFDAIGLDDNGSGVAATGTVTSNGTAATEAGSFTVTVGSQKNHTVTITVAVGDTNVEVATAIVTAINADSTMPVNATSVSSVVTFTAINAGTYGNGLGIEIIGTVAGITLVIGTMSSGATDPTLTAVLDVIGDERYQGIVWPYASVAQLAILTDFLDARFNAENNVLDGVGFTAATDTFANLIGDYTALNSQSLVIIGDKAVPATDTAKGLPAVFEIPAVKASQFAAIRALRLTQDASITRFLSGQIATDSFGGPQLASRPYFNTPFPNIPILRADRGFSALEEQQLNDAGVCVMGNNRAGNTVLIGTVVTSYKTDSGGNPDLSFVFLNYVDTASGIREYIVNNLNSRFAQTRLTTGDLVPGIPMANAELIQATMAEFYDTLSGAGFGLTVAGEDARDEFLENMTITIDLALGKVTILMDSVPLVTQLRTINATMRISFGATGN